MFLGHALLGFALAGGVALAAGWGRERAVALAVLTAAFATAPDIDMLYAAVGVAEALGSAGGMFEITTSFWATGSVVHRSMTHSLVVALPIAAVAGLWTAWRRQASATRRTAGVARSDLLGLCVALVLGAAVVAAVASSGLLAGAIVGIFGLTALAISEVAVRRTAFSGRAVVGAALVGVGSHPFGDLLTGEPPAFLYPLDVVFVGERIALSADPTLHLLAAFGVELIAIWLGIVVFLRLYGVSPSVVLSPRATLGAGYAAGVLVVPAPTLDVSYPFVFTVLAVGLVGVVPQLRFETVPGRLRVELPSGTAAVVTGLAAVTVAWAAYSATYLLV